MDMKMLLILPDKRLKMAQCAPCDAATIKVAAAKRSALREIFLYALQFKQFKSLNVFEQL